MKKAEQVN